MATTDSAERVQIGTGPKQPTPALDLKGWTRFLRWIFLTGSGRRPCPAVSRLVAVPQPLTEELRDAARRAYEANSKGVALPFAKIETHEPSVELAELAADSAGREGH